MTSQKVTQPAQNPATHQSKNKRKKNRKKNKKPAANGLAEPIQNTMEPNVTLHTADHPPIDKESVTPSAVNLPVTSSFLSEISTELDLAFGSNSLIDNMDKSNTFKSDHYDFAATAKAADVPEKVEESDYGLTNESIKSNLVVETEPVVMETDDDKEKEGDESSIDTQQDKIYTGKPSQQQEQQPTTEEEGGGKSVSDPSISSQQQQEVEKTSVLETISINTSNKKNIIPMVSPLSDESDNDETLKEEEDGEDGEDGEKEEVPKKNNNVTSAVEESSFLKEQMDENGGNSLLSDESKNKSPEFPLHAKANDLNPTVHIKENKTLSDAVSFAINSVIASRIINTEHIIKQVVHDIESGKYKVESRGEGINGTQKVDKLSSGSCTIGVVSSNVYKHEPSIEICGLMEGAVQCPEPAVGSTGQRMPSSMKTADTPKIAPPDHQRKLTFAAALKKRSCIIL